MPRPHDRPWQAWFAQKSKLLLTFGIFIISPLIGATQAAAANSVPVAGPNVGAIAASPVMMAVTASADPVVSLAVSTALQDRGDRPRIRRGDRRGGRAR